MPENFVHMSASYQGNKVCLQTYSVLWLDADKTEELANGLMQAAEMARRMERMGITDIGGCSRIGICDSSNGCFN